MPINNRVGGLSTGQGTLFDTNIPATSIDKDIFTDQEVLTSIAEDDLVLMLDVSEDPDVIKYMTRSDFTSGLSGETITVTDNESTDETNLITFVAGAASTTGLHAIEMDGDLNYNPSTGRLTATQLAGTLQTASQTNITGVGTISTGTWEGTTVAVAQGGTGATTLNNLITLATHTTGDYVQNITAGTGLTSTGATSGENIAHSLSVDASQTQITGVGTISTGTWEGDTIAVTQGGTGATSLSNLFALGTHTTGNYMTDVSAGTLVDVSHTPGEGSTATVNVDLTEAAEAAIANGDYLLFLDGGATGTHAKEAVHDLATLFAGTGLTASNSVIGVDASQTQITAVGTIATGTWEGTTVAVAQGGTGATSLSNLITLGTHTTGDYAATITAGTGLTSTGATSGEGIAHSLSVDASQTQITSVGTIGTGVWEGTTVAVAQGGTGATTLNDLITLTTHTTGNYVGTVTAGTGLTSTGATSGEGIAHSLSVDAAQSGITSVGTLTGLTLDGDKSVTPGDGAMIHLDTSTITDSATAGSGTAAKYTHVTFEAPTLAATNTSVTTSDAATVYINNAATASTNQTITRNWALWVDAGNARFDGSIYTGTTHAMNSSGLLQVANQSNITGVSTITSGTWSTGAVIGGATITVGSDATGDVYYRNASGVLTRLGVGSDADVLTLASGVPSWATPTVGDITGVTAGNGLSGGGTSGALSLALDLSELTDTAIAHGDYIVFTDTNDSNASVKGDLADVATLFAGTGLTASSSVIGVDASQTQITGVGTITTGTWEGTTVAVAQGGTGATSLNNLITMGTHTSGNYVAAITAGTGLTSTGATSGETISHSLSVDASQTQITAVGTLTGLTLDGDKSVTPGDGAMIHLDTSTITDSATAGSGTAAKYAHVAFEAPTLAATNSSVTTSDVATLYINNAATAGTNQTITRNWAMWVDAGNARFDGSIYSGTTEALSSAGLVTVANQSNITGVGTVTSGTWSTGAVIAGATMTLGSDATGDVYYRNASGVLTRLAVGSDADVLTLSSGIPSWATPTVGDITGVTAGVGLSGGGTSGALTLALDLSELSAVTPTSGDWFATLDSDGANEQLTTTDALATLFAGTGLTAASGVIGVDASQTQVTAVGTIATGTWEGTTIAVAQGGTGATTLNNLITMGTHTTGNYVATVTAGTGLTSTGATSGESIAHSLSVDASQTQITSVGALDAGSITSNFGTIDTGSSNITTTGTVSAGNLTVTGTTTTINSTVTTVVDPIMHLQTASGGGALAADTNKDVGLALQYYTDAAKTAFLGYDDSAGRLTFVKEASLSSEVISGTLGDLDIGGIYATDVTLDGDKSVTPGDGAMVHVDTSTITDSATAGSGTAAKYTHVNIEAPTLAATNASVTTSDVATLYINAAATAGTNQTITRNWAMWVDTGNARFDGSIYSGTTEAINSSGLVQVANQSAITGLGTISSGTWEATDVAVAHGGTGASTASAARTNLGLGTAAVAATGISNTNVPVFTSGVADNDFLRVDGTSIEGRSASEVASDIGAATVGLSVAMAIAL